METIYGNKLPLMQTVMEEVLGYIRDVREQLKTKYGADPVEHCLSRIKTEESMREKCRRQNLPETEESALCVIHDAIGIRVVCAFLSDVYAVRDYLTSIPVLSVVEEKDYIRHAKPNGYRSLHLIFRHTSGLYVEIQLRTISEDTWAALEHNIKYKKEIGGNKALIVKELKRCADELASTDLSMQTLRDMIYEENSEGSDLSKLLLAEDTKDLNHALVTVLSMQNYDVDAAYDGEEALSLIRQNGYDGIILDIMMPRMSGLEVLRDMRAHNITTPVLLLTAKSEVDDRVQGLDDGADDYLTKPFAMKELLARVRSLVRRGKEYHAKELRCGDLTLNAENLELTAENTVRLSMKEFELMHLLIQNEGKELSTKGLLEHVWSDEPDAGADTVWLYINFLKGKLGSISSSAVITGSAGGSFCLRQNGK